MFHRSKILALFNRTICSVSLAPSGVENIMIIDHMIIDHGSPTEWLHSPRGQQKFTRLYVFALDRYISSTKMIFNFSIFRCSLGGDLPSKV